MIGPGEMMVKPEARAPARKSAEGASPDADAGVMAKTNAGSNAKAGAADETTEAGEKGDFQTEMAKGDAAETAGDTGLAPPVPTTPSLPGTAALSAALAAASADGGAATKTAEGADTAIKTTPSPDGAQSPDVTPDLILDGETDAAKGEAKTPPPTEEGATLSVKAVQGPTATAPLLEGAEATASPAPPSIAPITAQAAAPTASTPPAAPKAPLVKAGAAPTEIAAQGPKPSAADAADFINPDAVDPETLLPQKETLIQTDKLPPAIPSMSSAPLDRLAGGPIGGEQGAASALNTRLDAGTLTTHALSASAASDRPPPQAQAIVAQIGVAVSKSNSDRVEVRLDPPELGRLNMIMNVSDDRAIVLVSAERQDVVDLLRRHSDLLQQTLAEAGFGDVSLEFAQSDKDAAGEQAGDSEGGEQGTPPDLAAAPLRVTWPGTPVQAGRLDLRL